MTSERGKELFDVACLIGFRRFPNILYPLRLRKRGEDNTKQYHQFMTICFFFYRRQEIDPMKYKEGTPLYITHVTIQLFVASHTEKQNKRACFISPCLNTHLTAHHTSRRRRQALPYTFFPLPHNTSHSTSTAPLTSPIFAMITSHLSDLTPTTSSSPVAPDSATRSQDPML